MTEDVKLGQNRHDWFMPPNLRANPRGRLCARCGVNEYPQHPQNCAGRHPVADEAMDGVKLDEATVRACIEALPDYVSNSTTQWWVGFEHCALASRAALEALLPKPDPAKALVDEFGRDTSDAGGSSLVGAEGMSSGDARWHVQHFANWLIKEGHIRAR